MCRQSSLPTLFRAFTESGDAAAGTTSLPQCGAAGPECVATPRVVLRWMGLPLVVHRREKARDLGDPAVGNGDQNGLRGARGFSRIDRGERRAAAAREGPGRCEPAR